MDRNLNNKLLYLEHLEKVYFVRMFQLFLFVFLSILCLRKNR